MKNQRQHVYARRRGPSIPTTMLVRLDAVVVFEDDELILA